MMRDDDMGDKAPKELRRYGLKKTLHRETLENEL
jgi:hypothetical protein